jgi:hypothetical protein
MSKSYGFVFIEKVNYFHFSLFTFHFSLKNTEYFIQKVH